MGIIKYIVVAIIFIWPTTLHADPFYCPYPLARVATNLEKAAMKYHGIGFAEYRKYGLWFKRGGQWCQLFSAGFLDKLYWREW